MIIVNAGGRFASRLITKCLLPIVEYFRDRLDPDVRDGFDQSDLCAATIGKSERERETVFLCALAHTVTSIVAGRSL